MKSNKSALKRRRELALERLRSQQKKGTKMVKAIEATQDGTTWQEEVLLTEKDVKRINKEIKILEERI